MGRATAFFFSNIGQKMIMAVTGLVLYGFVVGHLLGNLQVFAGPTALNRYAAFLKGTGELLWVFRLGLLLALVLHLVAAAWVTIANWQARPVSYDKRKDIATSYAARTMIVSGPLILLYVVYHLMMFTFLSTGPGYSETDVYRNVVLAFQVPAISAVYILAMIVLGFHLYHGGWSMLQSLGIDWPTRRGLRWILFPALSILVAVGYILIPVAVLAGIIR